MGCGEIEVGTQIRVPRLAGSWPGGWRTAPRVANPEPDAEADRWTAPPATADMPARARVQAAVAAIEAAGEEPTTDGLAAVLGVSERHVRRIVNGTQKRTELKR